VTRQSLEPESSESAAPQIIVRDPTPQQDQPVISTYETSVKLEDPGLLPEPEPPSAAPRTSSLSPSPVAPGPQLSSTSPTLGPPSSNSPTPSPYLSTMSTSDNYVQETAIPVTVTKQVRQADNTSFITGRFRLSQSSATPKPKTGKRNSKSQPIPNNNITRDKPFNAGLGAVYQIRVPVSSQPFQPNNVSSGPTDVSFGAHYTLANHSQPTSHYRRNYEHDSQPPRSNNADVIMGPPLGEFSTSGRPSHLRYHRGDDRLVTALIEDNRQDPPDHLLAEVFIRCWSGGRSEELWCDAKDFVNFDACLFMYRLDSFAFYNRARLSSPALLELMVSDIFISHSTLSEFSICRTSQGFYPAWGIPTMLSSDN